MQLKFLRNRPHVKTAYLTKTNEEGLFEADLPRQLLAAGYRQFVRIEHIRIFLERNGVPEPMRFRKGMRADAEPAVRGARPVLQIMTAFEARPRPIGNLVVNVAGPG